MRRGINRAFDDVVARGMAKTPGERFASAGELAKAATGAVEGIQPPTAPADEANPPPTVPIAAPSPRPDTRQFSAVYQNPAGTGYTPYPPPAVRPPQASARKSRLGPAQVALVVATIVLFGVAVVLAMQLMKGDRDSAAPPQTTVAVPPPTVSTSTETVEPSTTTPSATSTTSTTPTTPTTTTSGAPLPGVSGTDAQGFVGHEARCDAGSTPAAAIRTAQSLAVICETTPGNYYYHGERLRDGANVKLANAVQAGGGFDVTNPADGASYEVRPDHLTIRSNGHVDSNEPALEYGSGQ
jgi:serine/threonine protein kinase, bacterial